MGKLNWVTKACGVFLLWAATAVALPAQTFTSLQSFDGTDGQLPWAGVIQAANGDLYGTTPRGGADNDGTVYKITPDGRLSTVYEFCSQGGGACTDGWGPLAGLIQGSDGNLYGATNGGGAYGGGTVFKMTANGTLTSIYSFCAQKVNNICMDGAQPDGGLVQGLDGSFYGTTFTGGINNCFDFDGCGTVFKLAPNGTLTTLHSFQGTDGGNSISGLVAGADGNFYGTTYNGGHSNSKYCLFEDTCGTVFKITPSGTLTTLHSFCAESPCLDGANPYAGLVLGSDGSFYGTTAFGGANDSCGYGSCGTVFKITASGTLTTFYSFEGSDGADPYGGLVQGTDGNLYGTTTFGGAYPSCAQDQIPGCGTVFQITPGGRLTTLHSFDLTDGNQPFAGLAQDTNGIFYGTTHEGGASDSDGTVFSLSVGLGPFVETNPVAGKVGGTVGILGTNLTGATGVKFNGTETAFRVVSSSFIEAKVPSDATTGTVQVQLPSGTLSSNVPFIVLP